MSLFGFGKVSVRGVRLCTEKQYEICVSGVLPTCYGDLAKDCYVTILNAGVVKAIGPLELRCMSALGDGSIWYDYSEMPTFGDFYTVAVYVKPGELRGYMELHS